MQEHIIYDIRSLYVCGVSREEQTAQNTNRYQSTHMQNGIPGLSDNFSAENTGFQQVFETVFNIYIDSFH